MASSDDALETYNHLPIHVDPATKQISASTSDKSLLNAIALVNDIYTQSKTLENANGVPPPPMPVNPKRSAQIQKLRESATQASKKGSHAEAVRLLSFAIDMASARPDWEPVGLKRDELAGCYLSRALAYAELREWVDALRDAKCSTECKKGPTVTPQGQRIYGNPKAFTVGGKALLEMGRTEEAVEWLENGVQTEGNQGTDDTKNLAKMLDDAKEKLDKESPAAE
jgi:translocation protein SEC72